MQNKQAAETTTANGLHSDSEQRKKVPLFVFSLSTSEKRRLPFFPGHSVRAAVHTPESGDFCRPVPFSKFWKSILFLYLKNRAVDNREKFIYSIKNRKQLFRCKEEFLSGGIIHENNPRSLLFSRRHDGESGKGARRGGGYCGMKAAELIRSRRSVRSFDGRSVPEELRQELLAFANSVETPYELPIEWCVLDAEACGLSSPVITGTDTYIAGKLKRVPHAEEAFGFAFERIVLYALSKGLGTTWIAGTMDRPAFERAMHLKEDEVMPCVSPLGFPAAKMSFRESMMRKGVRADSRLPFGELFFDGDFDTPLRPEKAGDLADTLEMVRWAPSAVNRQPWRLLLCGDTVHFCEKQSRGFVDSTGWDLQKVDLGIAMCHFACGMEEKERRMEFSVKDPGLALPAGMLYTASFRLL